MIQEDQRKAERTVLLAQPKGELCMYVKGERCLVHSVLTISPLGISLRLTNYVDNDVDVVVEYKHEDINLRVNGTVVWSRSVDARSATQMTDRSCHVGINLMSPHLLFSLMQTA